MSKKPDTSKGGGRMRALIAGGGTAGHINPAIAIANKIMERQPDSQILFAGTKRGMESRLVPQAGFDFAPIEVRGFQRKLSLHNLKNNFLAVFCLFTSQITARKIIKSFKPDVVIGTGGYVSGPIVLQAAKMGIKTVIHEQNAYAGVTTKLLSKNVDMALLAVEAAAKYLDPKCRHCTVGNPIREQILTANRKNAREKYSVGDRVCILSFGGSLGAAKVNEAVAELMKWHYKTDRFYHIHATGSYEKDSFSALLDKLGVDKKSENLNIREYIDDMPDCIAAADVMISRAGAITLSEIEAAGKGSVLIPSPNVAENHQYHNAMVLANAGAAVVIEEKNLTGEALCRTISELTEDGKTLAALGRNASKLAVVDSADRIYAQIMKILS